MWLGVTGSPTCPGAGSLSVFTTGCPAHSQGRKDAGTLPRCPCDLEPLVRGVLGQVQLAEAVGEHGLMSGRRIQPAPLDLTDQRDLSRGVRIVLSDVLFHFADNCVIGETGNRDALHAHSSTGASGRGPTIPVNTSRRQARGRRTKTLQPSAKSAYSGNFIRSTSDA